MGQHSAGFVWEQPCSFLHISFVVMPGTLAETAGDSALVRPQVKRACSQGRHMTPRSEVKVCKASWNLRSEMSRGISTTIFTEASPQARLLSGSERDPSPRWEKLQSHTARGLGWGRATFEATFANSTTVAVINAFATNFNVDSWWLRVSSCRTFFLSVKQVKYF